MSDEKIQNMEAKSQLVEKITFALLPLLFSCVVYLMSALSNLSHEVTILNSKISLVVTSDNKQATPAPNWPAKNCAKIWKKKFNATVTKLLKTGCTLPFWKKKPTLQNQSKP